MLYVITNEEGTAMKSSSINQYAVANFLSTMDLDLEKGANIINARIDAMSYGWSGSTLKAVLDGIEKAYADKEE